MLTGFYEIDGVPYYVTKIPGYVFPPYRHATRVYIDNYLTLNYMGDIPKVEQEIIFARKQAKVIESSVQEIRVRVGDRVMIMNPLLWFELIRHAVIAV